MTQAELLVAQLIAIYLENPAHTGRIFDSELDPSGVLLSALRKAVEKQAEPGLASPDA